MKKDELTFLQQALNLAPQNVEVLTSLGKSYHAQAQYKEAQKVYAKALKIAPKNAQIHYLAAFSWERLGQKKRALAALKKALELKPDFQEARAAIEKRQRP